MKKMAFNSGEIKVNIVIVNIVEMMEKNMSKFHLLDYFLLFLMNDGKYNNNFMFILIK